MTFPTIGKGRCEFFQALEKVTVPVSNPWKTSAWRGAACCFRHGGTTVGPGAPRQRRGLQKRTTNIEVFVDRVFLQRRTNRPGAPKQNKNFRRTKSAGRRGQPRRSDRASLPVNSHLVGARSPSGDAAHDAPPTNAPFARQGPGSYKHSASHLPWSAGACSRLVRRSMLRREQ